MVGDMCSGTKSDLKPLAHRNLIGCVVRHYWLGWGLLWLFYRLVRHPWRRFNQVPLSRWYQGGICDPYTGAVDQNFVVMDENALPCRACWVKEYTECEKNRMYGLAWPSPHVNPTEHVWDILQNIQVLGQLNHRCGMTSQTRSFRIGQEWVHMQSENWFAASLVCVRLFLTLDVTRRFICLTLCVTWNTVCNNVVCKSACPTHQYANVQVSVVTTPFHPSLLLNFFTIVNYRYIVVHRINGFLCIYKINENVPLSFCGP